MFFVVAKMTVRIPDLGLSRLNFLVFPTMNLTGLADGDSIFLEKEPLKVKN